MRLSSDKSLQKFFGENKLYSASNLNEGFFGELFKGLLKGFASLFGVEIDIESDGTYTYSSSEFNNRAARTIASNDYDEKALKLDDDVDLDNINWDDLDPEKAPDEESKKERIKLTKAIVNSIVAENLEGTADQIKSLKDVPAFFEATEEETAVSEGEVLTDADVALLAEKDAQIQDNKSEMEAAAKALGKLVGTAKFIKEKIKDFDFSDVSENVPTTPGDLVQQAFYIASRISDGFSEKTEEPSKIIDFAKSYSDKNEFSIKPDDSKHTPSKDVEGEKGEAIAAAGEELESTKYGEEEKKELEDQIEELEPELVKLIDTDQEAVEDQLAPNADKIGLQPEDILDIALEPDDFINTAQDEEVKYIDLMTQLKDIESRLPDITDDIILIDDEESDELEKERQELQKFIDSLYGDIPDDEVNYDDVLEPLGDVMGDAEPQEFIDAIEDPQEFSGIVKKQLGDEDLEFDEFMANLNKLADEFEDKVAEKEELEPEGATGAPPSEEEIEQQDITDEAEQASKEADVPKDGVTMSLTNWFDSLSATSQQTISAKDRMKDLRGEIFQAIDRSVDGITDNVSTAIQMWRDENEETLINSKRFAKKNFDSLEELIPQMVSFILKKSNESPFVLNFGVIKETVYRFLDRKFKSNKTNRPSLALMSENSLEDYIESKIITEIEFGSKEDGGDPEVEADPTDEIQAAGKSKLSAKDAVAKAMNDWGASLSKTSQETLKSKLRGETLNDLIGTAVDDSEAIIRDEVTKAIKDWRSKHEEVLIKSKRFAKKNFDSLEQMIPDLVVSIMTKANESRLKLTPRMINSSVHRVLDRKFYHPHLMSESARWRRLAGLK